MPAPSVLIAANPYEGELCRKALADTGLQIEMVDSIEAAMTELARSQPLAVLVADGWSDADARELLVEVRSTYERLPIYLLEDRGSDIRDEEAAIRRGATRLFLRPINLDALAAAIEKLAVEAELSSEGLPDIPTEESLVEFDAMAADEWDQPSHVRAAPLPQRTPTEILEPSTTPGGSAELLETVPPMARLPLNAVEGRKALLRADEALADAAGLGLPSLATHPDFVIKVADRETPPSEAVTPPARRLEEFQRWQALADKSTFARRLDAELSEVERRLFPDASATPARNDADLSGYDDAMSDIDLDALGLDTVPGIKSEKTPPLAMASRATPLPNRGGSDTDRLPAAEKVLQRVVTPVKETGALADHDLATLLAALHASGFGGRVALTRSDGEKHLYFDAGQLVFATSTFVQDRLGDLLYREGKLTREQHARTRALVADPGQPMASLLVEEGLCKSSELFPLLRRHTEEILYSCFGWDTGTYQLGPEETSPENRVRLSAHPCALFIEGVRRKYTLERLTELLGSPETVLQPTDLHAWALDECGLSEAERVVAELFDGERSLADLKLAILGKRGIALSESARYALAWGLVAVGALRFDSSRDASSGAIVHTATTVVPSLNEGRDRRSELRKTKDGDRASLAIDRERVLAKRAQISDCDYFSVLGVDRQATPYEIERAFEKLRSDFLPDHFDEAVRAELASALSEITEVLDEARRVLLDETVRKSYSHHLIDIP